jgi:class 3 adenylate cyclase
MQQQIRFCTTSDGVRIAYSTIGEGPPLLFLPGWITHLELDMDMQWRGDQIRAFARHFTVGRFDKRGSGLSDRGIDDFSIDARLRDVDAVLAALKWKRMAIFAISEGGPAAITFAARNPRRVSHLALYATFARGSRLGTPETQEALLSLIRAQWGIGSEAMASIFLPSADHRDEFAAFQRRSATKDDAVAALRSNYDMDVTGLLPKVRCPTLILHSRRDRAVPYEQARVLAAGIPGARLVTFDFPSHLPQPEDGERLTNEIIDFLLDRRPAAPSRSTTDARLRTIVFTDLEGSTALTERLGDAGARELLRAHEAMTREALTAHGGTELKTVGDGFVASFESATAALSFAIDLQRRLEGDNGAGDGLRVRIGVHAGEPIAEQGDLFGTAMNMAARIASEARGGEIYASDVVRQLAAGKQFAFAPRGERQLKGFAEPVPVHEVDWRGGA